MRMGKLVIMGLIAVGVISHSSAALSDPTAATACPESPPAPSADEEASPIEPWMIRLYWKRMRERMTEPEVQAIFGEPKAKEQTACLLTWYYQAAPVPLTGGSMQRTHSGTVTFKRFPAGSGEEFQTIGWKEPDWRKVTECTPAQYQSQQAQRQLARRQAEIEQLRLARDQQAAQRRQRLEELRRQQTPAAKEGQTSKRPPPKTPTQWMGLPKQFWVMAGGTAGAMAALMIVLRGPFRT